MDELRVVLADDHPVVRAAVRNELQASGIRVIGEAANGEDTLRLAERLQPDVLVLDIEMPGLNGLAVARRLRENRSTVPILVLSAYSHDVYVFGLLEAGATGYILKDEALETIVMAVRAAARGEPWFSPKVAAQVISRAIGQGGKAPTPLTEREVDVLRLIAKGLNNGHIAQQLCLSERTVKYHVCNIYSKLDVRSRGEAMLWAMQYQLA